MPLSVPERARAAPHPPPWHRHRHQAWRPPDNQQSHAFASLFRMTQRPQCRRSPLQMTQQPMRWFARTWRTLEGFIPCASIFRLSSRSAMVSVPTVQLSRLQLPQAQAQLSLRPRALPRIQRLFPPRFQPPVQVTHQSKNPRRPQLEARPRSRH